MALGLRGLAWGIEGPLGLTVGKARLGRGCREVAGGRPRAERGLESPGQGLGWLAGGC